MSTVTPALRGRMGSTEFYFTRIKARELVSQVRPASELDDWSTMTLEDRMQRDPNMKRVTEEIAPYIADTKDRFFGSLIVLVHRGRVEFESFSQVGGKVPKAYSTQAEDIGFLTIDGGELIALDGQHRLLALEQVIKQKVRGTYAVDVASDDVAVIFIAHEDSVKTRQIFNRVNRYAKPTSRADNLITSEDDGFAIITRRLLNRDALFGKESLINWKSNTLGERSTQFSTLSALYEISKLILEGEKFQQFSSKSPVRPAEESLDEAYQLVSVFWGHLLSGVKCYRTALQDVRLIPEYRKDVSQTSLLFKPAAQIAVVEGLYLARSSKLKIPALIARLNLVNWSMRHPQWANIIINPNHTINASTGAKENMAYLVAHLIAGTTLSPKLSQAVLNHYANAHGVAPDQVGQNGQCALPHPVSVEAQLDTILDT